MIPQITKPKKINFSDLIVNSPHEMKVFRGILKDKIISLFNEVITNK